MIDVDVVVVLLLEVSDVEVSVVSGRSMSVVDGGVVDELVVVDVTVVVAAVCGVVELSTMTGTGGGVGWL
ncbi:hypothetical protein BOO86_06940 [Mycobacterium sp. CBMA 234]|nr:hypothetical protein [Mycolicibacterium sp. CBMA 234]